MRRAFIFALFAATAEAQTPALTPAQIARIDSAFSQYAAQDVPGCALGISRHDTVVLERAWGMANLETGTPITPATIFEAGSVSKQFTAGAILRLVQQGKLLLDDDVRKYLPELQQYDAPITLRHMMNHTSGLRDWGTVMAIAGWPRGTRTYTQAHVLDIVARQRGLNYPVGAEYLYSNSNYNLLAMVVERVSGKTLAEFTKAEFFDPLGMTSTGWRDDYARIVRGRAQAYSGENKNWKLSMPFENVYGNSSLLTTVGDLLKWSANSGHKRVGGEQFATMQTTRGKLKSGKMIRYAGGVSVDSFQGTPEIAHDGATAGYRAWLARYPEAGYAVALLCNAGNVSPVTVGRHLASVVLPEYKAPRVADVDTIGISVPVETLTHIAGYYRAVNSDDPLRLMLKDGRIMVEGGSRLVAVSANHFTSVNGRTHVMFAPGERGSRGVIQRWTTGGDTTQLIPVEAPLPDTSIGDYVGRFYSEEADATVQMLKDEKGFVMFTKPNTRFAMTPIYRDGFSGPGAYVKFTRGRDGKVDGFLVTSGRARNIRFDKVTAQ